jgi:hypothetical protein
MCDFEPYHLTRCFFKNYACVLYCACESVFVKHNPDEGGIDENKSRFVD